MRAGVNAAQAFKSACRGARQLVGTRRPNWRLDSIGPHLPGTRPWRGFVCDASAVGREVMFDGASGVVFASGDFSHERQTMCAPPVVRLHVC